MAANFAPYQDEPETARALSPPPLPSSPRTSLDRPSRIITSPAHRSSYDQNDYFQPIPPAFSSGHPTSPTLTPPPHAGLGGQSSRRWTRPREDVDMFTTSLGWRLDYEACLAYLLLPPAGGVLLLVLEHQSDYVRFHAWQSSLLFAFMFVVHIIFSFSKWISWVLVAGDVAGIAWLSWKAWVDGELCSFFPSPPYPLLHRREGGRKKFLLMFHDSCDIRSV